MQHIIGFLLFLQRITSLNRLTTVFHVSFEMDIVVRCLALLAVAAWLPLAYAGDTIAYRFEASGSAFTGRFAPLWLSANRYGLSDAGAGGGYVLAGMTYSRPLGHDFCVEAGVDLVAGVASGVHMVVQQAYADMSWRHLRLSVGSKERWGYPMDKNHRLSSGMMVEGPNARPVPQVRFDLSDFVDVPFTGGWLGFKGHVAYGMFTDNGWQREFAAPGKQYTRNTLYHSKSAMLRIGRRDRFPLTLGIGFISAAQFGGMRMKKQADGSAVIVENMPNKIPDFFYMLMPSHRNTLENVEGNHCGSWNVSADYYGRGWKARVYIEHYFEDHSQMTMQYGLWRDGQLGVEVSLPRNRWVSTVLYEALRTTDQTGPILYDGVGGTFDDVQMSGCDNYYNNGQFLGWQHWGYGLGHPFLPGPVYNDDGSNEFKSTRVQAHHLGIDGSPTRELSYRLLMSHVRHRGTYKVPLDRVRRQFSSYAEVTYSPVRFEGWSATLGIGVDGGDYLGASTGAVLTIKKTGLWTR